MDYFKSGKNQFQIILMAGLMLFFSCSKDDETAQEISNLNHLISLSTETLAFLFESVGDGEMASLIKYPVDIYSFNYPMSYRQENIEASGLICVPVSPGESFPVMSFQHGTLVAKSEAPSLTYNSLQNLMVAGLAGLGYTLIIPDLIGFGASASFFHPYLVKESNVDAVVSMLSALLEIPNGDLSGSTINDSLFLAGYSQGGWATLSVLEKMDKDPNNHWNIIATACGAGPYNPALVLDYVIDNETYAKPFFIPYVLLSFIEDGTIYGNLNNYFKEPYASIIPELYDGSKIGIQIDAALTSNTHDLIKEELFDYKNNSDFTDLINSLDLNSIKAWNTNAPILFLHGESDVYIPKILSETIYSDFMLAEAANVQYISIPMGDHNTAVIPSISLAMDWFQSFRSVKLISAK